MRCSTRGCPYPQDRRGLCAYHASREEPVGDKRRGTVTPDEHNIWCDMEGLRHESAMREIHRVKEKAVVFRGGRSRISAEKKKQIRQAYMLHPHQRDVGKAFGVAHTTVARYTKDLRGVA